MGNGLRMSLARNKTSANRLDIIYDAGADLYNMRFYAGHQQKDIRVQDEGHCRTSPSWSARSAVMSTFASPRTPSVPNILGISVSVQWVIRLV